MEFEKLQGIIADVLNVQKEEIKPETTFVDDLGADSLDLMQIVMGIEEEFLSLIHILWFSEFYPYHPGVGSGRDSV